MFRTRKNRAQKGDKSSEIQGMKRDGTPPISSLDTGSSYSISGGHLAPQQQSMLTTSPISPVPPMLPPIPRVASVRASEDGGSGTSHGRNQSVDSWVRHIGGSQQLYGEVRSHGRGFSTSEVETGYRKTSQGSSRPTTGVNEDVSSLSQTGGFSRPQTSSSFGRPGSQDPNLLKSPPIVFMGPALREQKVSPSQFPSDSHRPAPKPPQTISFSTVPKLAPAPKQSRNKLNLLNPMSLLKRRSAAGGDNPDDDLASQRTPGTVSALPADFDPSIRGKVVHDFSAPRDRRTPSANSMRLDSGYSTAQGYSSMKVRGHSQIDGNEFRQEREHTPVFREHFDDGPSVQTSESVIRAEQLANQDFISRNSGAPPAPFGPLPALSKYATAPGMPSLSKPLPPLTINTSDIEEPSDSPTIPPPLSPVVEDSFIPTGLTRTETTMKRQSAINKRTTTSTSRGRNRGLSSASRSSISSDGSGLPTHMSSRASRFSFQLAGKDSVAQERMLEERHREREAAQKAAAIEDGTMNPEVISEEEDNYDYDDFDEMEDDVPMVGDEWDYGGSIGTGYGMAMSMGTQNVAEPDLAMMALRGNPVAADNMNPLNMPDDPEFGHIHGLGIVPGAGHGHMPLPQGHQGMVLPNQKPSLAVQPVPTADNIFDDFDGDADDLYFDDGLIDEANFDDTQAFDESVLDDPNHPLYERKQINAPVSKDIDAAIVDDEEVDAPKHNLAPKNSVRDSATAGYSFANYPNPSTNSEQLASYHDLLAAAAIEAAQSGRFNRSNSIDTMSPDGLQINTRGERESLSQPSLVTDESRTSKATTMSPTIETSRESPLITAEGQAAESVKEGVVFTLPTDYSNDYNDFMAYNSDFSDYDSNFEEDPFIAAANADALANDFDGEYGSEFGFYARPSDESDSAEEGAFANGGYFGPKEWSEIKRKKSTREPNLTPITERSEYSTRNSFISIHALGGPQDIRATTQSPGLAQLARMSPGGWDAEMSLDALLKLKRSAFGGSQTSLRSLNSNRDATSSPLASSPIVPKSNEQRWIPSPMSYVDEESAETRHRTALVQTREEGGWEDASDDDEGGEEADYTDTEDIEEEPVPMSDETTIRGWSLNVPNSIQQVRPPSKSFSRPFSQRDPTTYPCNSLINTTVDRGESQTDASTQDSSTTISDTQFPSRTISSTSTLTSVIPSLQVSHKSEPAPLLAPFDFRVKAASGTFYSPGSASPVSPAFHNISHRGHSRSGSDTVTYVREPVQLDSNQEIQPSQDEWDGTGPYRWVLERRRTDQHGVEEVNREIVQTAI